MGKIADISYYQGDIDWDKARRELDLVVFRATCGTAIDRRYIEYTSACGLPYGAYCYVTAGNAEQAIRQAQAFVEHANKAAKRPYFYIADIEAEAQNAKTTEPVCVAFLEELRRCGCDKIGLYINTHYKWAGKAIGMCDIMWIPHWGPNTGSVPAARFAPDHPCDLWQYTSRGRIAGINTDVDLNMLYGSKPLAYFTTYGDVQERVRPTLRNGSRGEDVKALQERLAALGYGHYLGRWGADGDYGLATHSAVMAFQDQHGLEVDGIVGPKTWAALDAAQPPAPEPTYTVVLRGLAREEMEAMKTRWPDAEVSEE